MSTYVEGKCERNAFARGVCFSMIIEEVMNVIKVIVRAVFLFAYMNFVNGG
jgi:hypothetical protein